MSLAVQVNELFYPQSAVQALPRFSVGLAETSQDIKAALRLRYEVFVKEMGAQENPATPGIETDRFDPFCQHLVVRDNETSSIVGCNRILTDTAARRAGGYCSAGEFKITRILGLRGRIMEVGRTCVHQDYRNGTVIGLLWAGLERFMLTHRVDYLMGCASIPLSRGIEQIAAIYQQLAAKYFAPPELHVFPRVGLAGIHDCIIDPASQVEIPPLIKGYMRLGAKLCSDPAWDPEFNTADLFLLLNARDLDLRYLRNF